MENTERVLRTIAVVTVAHFYLITYMIDKLLFKDSKFMKSRWAKYAPIVAAPVLLFELREFALRVISKLSCVTGHATYQQTY